MQSPQYSTLNTFTRTGGWPGGTVTALALLPDERILAGTKAGIFRSADGGQSWQRVTAGPADPSIVALAVAPLTQDRQDIFATTEGGRLYHSQDGGTSWQEVTSWVGFGVGVAIAISPAYAADGTLFVAGVDGPLRSQDRGISWESSTFGLLDVDTLCITCSPNYARDETLWAGTAFGGFFRSRNGGRSWRESGAGLPDTAVQCMALAGDSTLYAGTEADGVFRSSDGGARWDRAGDELAGHSVNALAALPGCLLAGTSLGIFRAEDRGDDWLPCASGDSVAFALVGREGLALAGCWQTGISISSDGGYSWQTANGRDAAQLTGHTPPLAVLTPWQELYVADGDGASALSTDGGQSWQGLDFLAEDESCGLIASVGQDENFAIFVWTEEAVYRRAGEGAWQRFPSPGNGAAHVAFSPTYDQDNTLLLADIDGYLYLSEDRGESWQELAPPETEGDVLGLALAPGFAENRRGWLVTGGFDGQHIQVEVWQTDDAGESWADIAGLALDTPAISLLPLADPLRHPLLLAAQNRLITLYTDPDNGELAVDQRFLDVQIVSLSKPQGNGVDRMLLAATDRGVWQIDPVGEQAECIGLAEYSVVALFPGENSIRAVTLGGEVWQG